MSKITNDCLTPAVWHTMLYNCTHTATVGVKGLRPHTDSCSPSSDHRDRDGHRERGVVGQPGSQSSGLKHCYVCRTQLEALMHSTSVEGLRAAGWVTPTPPHRSTVAINTPNQRNISYYSNNFHLTADATTQ